VSARYLECRDRHRRGDTQPDNTLIVKAEFRGENMMDLIKPIRIAFGAVALLWGGISFASQTIASEQAAWAALRQGAHVHEGGQRFHECGHC
jgi:hypothetical protein